MYITLLFLSLQDSPSVQNHNEKNPLKKLTKDSCFSSLLFFFFTFFLICHRMFHYNHKTVIPVRKKKVVNKHETQIFLWTSDTGQDYFYSYFNLYRPAYRALSAAQEGFGKF